MHSQFESLGVYLPKKIVSTDELINQMKVKPKFNLKKITGIQNRRFCSEGEDSFTVALAAAKDCLKNSIYKASDLDIIIQSSISRFRGSHYKYVMDPPLSLAVKNALGATKAMTLDISNACAGTMTGAYILDNMIRAGTVKNGMVVSGECVSPIAKTAVKEINEKVSPQFASLTIGDAGAAFIMDEGKIEENQIRGMELLTFAKFADLSMALPSKQDIGVAMYTDSMSIHAAALFKIPVYLEKLMKRIGIKWEDMNVAIPHQTATKTIEKGREVISKHFNKPLEEFPDILVSVDQFGNTSSTSVIIPLYNAIKEKKIKKGSLGVFISLASGLVLGYIFAGIGHLHIKE